MFSIAVDGLVVGYQGATVDEIKNEELTLANVPSPDEDWDKIARFALTFDGYKVWGSFAKCAEVANAQRHETLTQLRTCLFFEQRRWHHFGEEPDKDEMEYLRNMVKQIRNLVAVSEEG